MYQITEEQQKRIEDKYGRLIYAIAYKIGGDKVTNSFEDSVQNLQISALDAVTTFAKSHDKRFDEFFNTTEFDKYIKTCLWNRKNKLGATLTKRKPVAFYVPIEEDIFSPDDLFNGDEIHADLSGFADAVKDMDEQPKKLINCILQDLSLVKPSGNLNITKLVKETGFSKKKIQALLSQIKNSLGDYER